MGSLSNTYSVYSTHQHQSAKSGRPNNTLVKMRSTQKEQTRESKEPNVSIQREVPSCLLLATATGSRIATKPSRSESDEQSQVSIDVHLPKDQSKCCVALLGEGVPQGLFEKEIGVNMCELHTIFLGGL